MLVVGCGVCVDTVLGRIPKLCIGSMKEKRVLFRSGEVSLGMETNRVSEVISEIT
jgi:hypothetical protein